ncbi:MAG: hypothetical protein HY674_18360 [Chloroflexi bacterium]|nr:hypothetical protein [Chloroflexota bacterium]
MNPPLAAMKQQNRAEVTEWRFKKWHLWLLIAGLILRAAFSAIIARSDPFGGWDGREYHAFARSLLALAGDDYPRFFNFVRAPGYPLILMPFVMLNPIQVWHIQLAQSLLGVFFAFLLGKVAARWAGAPTGDWAFCLAIFHPFLIYYCGFVLTETVFMTLLWLGVAGLQRLAGERAGDAVRWLSWSAMALGLACLVRPALQPFLIVAVSWLAIQAWRKRGWRAAWRHGFYFTAVVSALLLPWLAGNVWAHGRFTLGPGYGEAVYLQSNSMDFIRMYEAKTKDDYYRAFTRSVYHLSVTNGTPRETWLEDARAFRRQHAAEWRRMQWYKFTHFWRPWLNSLIFPRWQVLLSMLVTTPAFVLAGVELWRRRGSLDSFLKLLLSLIATGYLVGGVLFVASVRYRIPLVDVSFVLLSASWLSRCDVRKLFRHSGDLGEPR